jgi:predicted polyphosphate/ATP-dependent NAD kinase
MASWRVGLIVNPIAGMGGRVGLKGTDGAERLAEARRRGAVPVAAGRARDALAVLRATLGSLEILDGDVPGREAPGSRPESGEVSRRAATALADAGIDLLLFAGGDGTARDIASAVGDRMPILGIPTGVKMQSGVFATSPAAAGHLAAAWLASAARPTRRAEIVDLDEEDAARGRLGPRLFGYARVPEAGPGLQHRKAARRPEDDASLAAAGAELAARLDPDTLYVVGPGTAPKSVLAARGLNGTLLGVDLLRGGRLVATDVGEAEILNAAELARVHLILGVTGGQGFVLGRGNQPIGPRVVARAGRAGLTIIAGRGKLALLHERRLFVDSGDPAIDLAFAGHVRVVTGPGETAVMRLDPA